MKQSVRGVKLPIAEVLRVSGKHLLMAWGLAISNFTLVFLFQTFLLSYVTSTLGVKDTLILNSLLVVAALQLVTVPFFGYMCDVYGRRPVLMFLVWGLSGR